MASSAFPVLLDCARAVEDGDLKLVDSLLKQIWTLEPDEPDEQQSTVVKYFAEALVRRAYGLHPDFAYFKLQMTPPLYLRYWDGIDEESIGDAINNTLMGKKRMHLICFPISNLYCTRDFFDLVTDAYADALDNLISVRVSVILPPSLKKIINAQEEKDFRSEAFTRHKCKLEMLEVVYANSLEEVGESMLDFRRTEDEAVVVFYFFKLSVLLREAGILERELLKLRNINPDLVIIKEYAANHNHSDFIRRFEDSFQHYSHVFGRDNKEDNKEENCLRRHINNIVGCEGRDRIVRHHTLDQWRSHLETNGFFPFPLKLDQISWLSHCYREDNGCLVRIEENCPIYFISAWKLKDGEHHSNPIGNNFVQGCNPSPRLEDKVQPLQPFPEGFKLNQLAALAEIYDILEELCSEYKLELALTWTCEANMNEIRLDPYEKRTLFFQSTCCYFADDENRSLIRRNEVLQLLQWFARKALQSSEHFLVKPSISEFKELYHPKSVEWFCVASCAAAAICLQNRYATDDVYVVAFLWLPWRTRPAKAESLALRIFNSLKNMKTRFVKVRVQDTEIGSQEGAISNIPQVTVPMINPPPASSTTDFIYSNTRDGHVMVTKGLNEQRGVIPNFHPPLPMHASTTAGTGGVVLQTPGPHEPPMFKLQSQEALSSDIIRVYQEEKCKLLQYFGKLSCRFNLIISLWAYDLKKTVYCCYAVQFIDDNWELKKKILALESLENQVEKMTFFERIKKFLVDWKFAKKVCSLTIHNSSSCFKIVEEIRKSWHSFVASHPLSTFFFSSNDDECVFGLLDKDNSGEKNVEKSIDGANITSNAPLWDIFGIYKKLNQQDGREYPLMNVKFDNNCRTCSLVLAIAVVLDPQFRFDAVEYFYKAIHGNGDAWIHLEMIRYTLTNIFHEYARSISNEALFSDDTNSSILLNAGENPKESFYRWYNSKRNTEASSMSELDKYLRQSIPTSSNPEFNILGWWCEQASIFPILARMVRDILAIPMSSIISGSTFHEKVMMDNPIFSGLDPPIVEAMICGRDWLESPKENDRVNLTPMQNRAKRKMEEKETYAVKSCKKGTTTWTEKDVRAYLVSPFTDRELEHLRKWQTHAISGESVGQDKIPFRALAPLLMIPPNDVDSKNAPNYYIEDTVVNQFFVLLKKRYEKFPEKYMKHYSFDSCIAALLIGKSSIKDQVPSWIKKEDFKGVSKLFLPICLNKHWLLFYADIDDKKLLWLDSIENSRTSNDSEKQIIQGWFLEFLLPLLGHDHKDWSFDVPKNIPMQKNSVDCALFVMKYADCLTHGNYFPFTQDDMPHFRHRTFLDLYHESISLGGSRDDRANHAPLQNKAKSKRKMDRKDGTSLVKISKNWNSEETKSTGDNAKDSDINDGDPSVDNW